MRTAANQMFVTLLLSCYLSAGCDSNELSRVSQTCSSGGLVFDEFENRDQSCWIPSGWMPDGSGLSLEDDHATSCHGGKTCIKTGFAPTNHAWGGIYWLADGSWTGPGVDVYEKLGVPPGTPVRLTFWARGQEGGERVQFKVGGVTDGNDSVVIPVETAWITLDQDWKQYSVDFSDDDLSRIVGGFCWVTESAQNPSRNEIVFFLDDIAYEPA